jgi:hypothetical protein
MPNQDIIQKKQNMSNKEVEEFKQSIKAQIINEMKDEQTLATEEATLRREEEEVERQKYFKKMQASPDPWVEIVTWTNTDQGVKVSLEWNDAFIGFLKVEGITGADENQVVQKWVAMLLHNVADDMDNSITPEDESEFS